MWTNGAPGWRTGKPEIPPMRYVLIVVGGLMSLVGIVWLMQGVGVLPGSFMTGQIFWAVVGAICFILGDVLIFAGIRMGGRR